MDGNREKTTRRKFLKGSTAAATSVALGLSTIDSPLFQSALGANNKVRVGFIGVGNRGSQLLGEFLKQDDVEVAALCDVYEPYLTRDYSTVDKKLRDSLGNTVPEMADKLGAGVARYKDFRRLIERKDIDAVVISTPDHWHAIQTIMACQAEKDVYVEKPLSLTIFEGRKMVEAAKRYNRVVQVGLHRRSSKMYKQVAEQVQTGRIGKVTVARAYRINNMYPNGIGRFRDAEPPKNLDWDMWLGPRPKQQYRDNITPYKFRWWQSYSSQMANWGVHYCDAIRWVLGEQSPVSVSAHGGRFAVEDDRTIPDTMEVIFEFASGSLLIFGQYEANSGPVLPDGEIEFRGTRGNLYSETKGMGYKITPSTAGQFQDAGSRIESVQVKGVDGDLTAQHIRNFLDCVKTRQPTNCDMETGHRSTTFALLANIALATKTRIEWDPKSERIINNKQANNLLQYEYRKPWTLD